MHGDNWELHGDNWELQKSAVFVSAFLQMENAHFVADI